GRSLGGREAALRCAGDVVNGHGHLLLLVRGRPVPDGGDPGGQRIAAALRCSDRIAGDGTRDRDRRGQRRGRLDVRGRDRDRAGAVRRGDVSRVRAFGGYVAFVLGHGGVARGFGIRGRVVHRAAECVPAGTSRCG